MSLTLFSCSSRKRRRQTYYTPNASTRETQGLEIRNAESLLYFLQPFRQRVGLNELFKNSIRQHTKVVFYSLRGFRCHIFIYAFKRGLITISQTLPGIIVIIFICKQYILRMSLRILRTLFLSTKCSTTRQNKPTVVCGNKLQRRQNSGKSSQNDNRLKLSK